MLIKLQVSGIGIEHVGFWHAGFWLAARVLFAMRTARDFQSWRLTDEHALPYGLPDLEQLHVELSSEHLTSLHCNSIHYRRWKVVPGLEMWLGYKQAKLSGLAVLEQLRVELNSECSRHLSSTHKLTLSIHSQACGQATPTHAAHEAWCRYVLCSTSFLYTRSIIYRLSNQVANCHWGVHHISYREQTL